MFRACVSTRDTVGASGHVVSLVVANGCIANTPLSMLGNHVRSALASYTAEHPEQEDETHCAKFVLECITRIPSMLCKDLVKEVRNTIVVFSHRISRFCIDPLTLDKSGL